MQGRQEAGRASVPRLSLGLLKTGRDDTAGLQPQGTSLPAKVTFDLPALDGPAEDR